MERVMYKLEIVSDDDAIWVDGDWVNNHDDGYSEQEVLAVARFLAKRSVDVLDAFAQAKHRHCEENHA